MAHALEMEGVGKRFGAVVALEGVSLAIGEGETVGLVGRNGAGKTTLIHLATGVLGPSSGRLRVLGRDVGRDPVAVKRLIGVMPQERAQLECLTGPQLLDFVGRVHGLAASEIGRRSRELLELLDLRPAPRALIRDYSLGMQKKLALAAALLPGPRMLFLDEPFEGLDPVTGRTLRELLGNLRRAGVTVLMSSHQLELVEQLCPRVAVLERGRLLGFGSPDELRAGFGRDGTLESVLVEVLGGARRGELSWL